MSGTIEEIQNIISKFANSFDRKDWDGLKSVLCDEVECDYTSLRGAKEIVSAEEYVAKRKLALNEVDTHHIISNYEIDMADNAAECRASSMIWRRKNGNGFNTHALYTFKLVNEALGWKISAIKQEVLWNEGDASIHSGTKNG